MNKGMNLLLVVFAVLVVFSCKKDDVSENCYACGNEIASIDVCEENGNFVVDGEVIENEGGASLEDFVRAIEANPENDPNLEGVTCRRK